MTPKVTRKKIPTRGKIVPTTSLRKRLNDEREDLSHPNNNNLPRIPAKRVKTCSPRVPVRDSSISSSVPRVSVAPEEDSSQDSSAAKCSSSDSQAFCERWHPEANTFYFKWGQMTITLEDVSRLIGLRVDGELTIVEGKWGAAAVKEIFRKSMYLPDRVYPNLKAGGQGISLSLKKIVNFFAGKVGTNPPQAASSSSSPIKLSSRMVGKAYVLYVLGSFLFPTKKGTDVSVKYLSFFQDKDVNKPWPWGAATLAHLYCSLGTSSRVNTKGLACCTTLLESWIFEHFPKLPGISVPNQSGAVEFCSRWSWTNTTSALSGSAALNMFREALDNYKLQDVVWDPYLKKREDKHNFKEVASFTVSFAKLCPDVVILAKDDDYDNGRVLGDMGGVSQRENVEVPYSQNKGGRRPAEVVEDPTRSILVEALATKVRTLTNFLSYSCLVIHILGRELPCNNFVIRLLLFQTGECAFFMEANLRMEADIQAKDVANSICEKKLNEKTLECKSNKKLVEDLRMQLANKVKENEMLSSINDKLMEEVYVNQEARPLPLNLVPHSEENIVEVEMWKHKYEELNAKFEEAQRRLRERDRNGVWHLTLKGAIEGGDFEDTEYPIWEKLSRQFTKLLTIAQEGPKGEYEDDIILSGRGEYQERIDSRLKKIDHKTNLRQTLFQPFNWFQLDIRDVERDGGHLLATYYEKVVIFISNKEALTFLPLFWQKANNKITKEKRFENILADSTKYWWVGMTSDENFAKLKTKYQSPIPPVSTLWWAHVQLDIPDALVKPCVKNYFDAPNEAWMKLMRDNNVNLQDYSINNLFS
ncbi:hypothetical protein GIB67_042864 [Kingdonia uniflora]|uniref:Aminotransferase-like plant mobile domain-containing protein n=1 Tax=Kingdonia uniflora TaxID=39325 RepID=A0A7J7NSC1_9MAGN|nr:hypothetical protein GIB67_042864 [Kingdonia uniflora]